MSTAKTGGTKGLIAGQNGKVLDFVPTRATAVGTIVADEGAVAQEEQVGVRIEEGTAGIAPEAVDMPSIPRWDARQCGKASKCAA